MTWKQEREKGDAERWSNEELGRGIRYYFDSSDCWKVNVYQLYGLHQFTTRYDTEEEAKEAMHEYMDANP